MKSGRTARIALLSIVASMSLGGVAFAADPNADSDGDTIINRNDAFALDPANGTTTRPDLSLTFDGQGGGIQGTGFTGIMTNGAATFADAYPLALDGRLTLRDIDFRDPTNNNSVTSFQLGVDANPARTDCFTVSTRIVAPFGGFQPAALQSMGIFVGRGDQDHYAKVVTQAGYGRGVQSFGENGTALAGNPPAQRSVQYTFMAAEGLPGPQAVDLFLRVDPDTGIIEPSYRTVTGGVPGPTTAVGAPLLFPDWFTSGALAVGIQSTSYTGAGFRDQTSQPFAATWEGFQVSPTCRRPQVQAVDPQTGRPFEPVSGSTTLVADRTPPALTDVRVAPRSVRVRGRARGRGATVRFNLNEGARVNVTYHRLRGGRRAADGRCVAATRSNRRARACTRTVALRGTVSRGFRAGAGAVRFSGRISGRALTAGRYQAQVVAVDAAGNRSRIQKANFRVRR